MANTVQFYATEIMRHVPMVTSIGMMMALVLGGAWLIKRWREAALLAAVCVAYALTPFIPSMSF